MEIKSSIPPYYTQRRWDCWSQLFLDEGGVVTSQTSRRCIAHVHAWTHTFHGSSDCHVKKDSETPSGKWLQQVFGEETLDHL